MFIQDFVEVEASFDAVLKSMEAHQVDLVTWIERAMERGDQIVVGPGKGWPSVAVDLTLGETVVGVDSVSLPLEWTSKSASTLIPAMTAEIALHSISDGLTHVQFRGRYQPPLAKAGRLLDAAGLHRVAEMTVRSILSRFKEAIETDLLTTNF